MAKPTHKRRSTCVKNSRKLNRLSLVESLEHRQLFAADLGTMVSVPLPTNMDQVGAVVRANEPKPVLLQLGSVSYNGQLNSQPSLTIVSQPSHGSVSTDFRDLIYSLSYQPDKDFTGTDQFIVASTNRYPSSVYFYQVTVSVVGETWVATPDWASVRQGGSVSLDVLKNDLPNAQFSGVTGLQLKLKSVTAESGSSVKISADGRSIEYTASDDFEGVDLLHYIAQDQDGYSVEGTAQIRVLKSAEEDRLWPEQMSQLRIQELLANNAFPFGSFGTRILGFPSYDLDYHSGQLSISFQPSFDAATIYYPSTTTAAFQPILNATSFVDHISGTNNMVPGVDESDSSKSDGRYLYTLQQEFVRDAKTGIASIADVVHIFDFEAPEKPTLVATIRLKSNSSGMDLYDGKLTVFTQGISNVEAVVYDVSSPAAPKLLSSSTLPGNFNGSRRINDKLYVFTSSFEQTYGMLRTVNLPGGNFRYELGTEFLERITTDAELQPAYEVRDASGKTVASGTLTDYTQSSIADRELSLSSFTNIITFDANNTENPIVDWDITHATGMNQILVTDNSLYFASNRAIASTIEKFAVDDSGLHFAAQGLVTGTIPGVEIPLNEHDGFLHVVTVSQDNSTNVFVLTEKESGLEVVGSLNGIAPNEQLYSVRFDEDMAYLVTAEMPMFFAMPKDPLFTINLSDPTKPVVEGQLVVPGFSNYLQLMDDDKYLLSIGRSDVVDPTNLAISVYDVTNPKSPKMVDRFVLERTWLMGDHQSIKYLPESRTLSIATAQAGGTVWLVFNIDDNHKIRLENSVPSQFLFERSMQIGDSLVAIAKGEIKVLPMDDLSVSATSLVIPNPPPFLSAEPWIPIQPTFPSNPISITQPVSPLIILQSRNVVAGKTESIPVGSMTSSAGFKLVSASVEDDSGEVVVSEDGQTLNFSPNRTARGTRVVRYSLQDAQGNMQQSLMEFNVQPWSWSNTANVLDCNGDGEVRPMDALLTINLLDQHGPMTIEALDALVAGEAFEDLFQYDANEDGMISAVDALLVINELNRQQAAANSSRMMQQFADTSSIDQPESIESLLAGPYYYDPESVKIRK